MAHYPEKVSTAQGVVIWAIFNPQYQTYLIYSWSKIFIYIIRSLQSSYKAQNQQNSHYLGDLSKKLIVVSE